MIIKKLISVEKNWSDLDIRNNDVMMTECP